MVGSASNAENERNNPLRLSAVRAYRKPLIGAVLIETLAHCSEGAGAVKEKAQDVVVPEKFPPIYRESIT
jgi:hypothetical protein